MPVLTRHSASLQAQPRSCIGIPSEKSPAARVLQVSSSCSSPAVPALSPPNAKLRDPVLAELWLEIDDLTDKQGSTYGVIKKVLNDNIIKFPWLTRDLLNNYRRKATKQLKIPPLDISCNDKENTLVSDLTSKNMHSASSLPESRQSLQLAGSSLTVSTSSSPQSTNNDLQPTNHSENETEIGPTRNIGGRPKGTTNSAKESMKKRKLEALNEAAIKFMEAKESNISKRHGTLQKIVEDTNAAYNLHGENEIRKETVRTRCKEGRKLLLASLGPLPCILELEPFFVETFMKLAAMRQPVTPTESLQFINATVKSAGLEKKVQAWKQKHNKLTEVVADDGPLGKKYWSFFLKRHPSLATKTSTRFDSNREEWCNVTNFEQMYHSCYEKW
jgi:hypothetical protein